MIGGIICIISSIFSFIVIWFKLTPYLTLLIPNGEWKLLITFILYVFVAYIGGIAFPFIFFCLGMALIAKRL